MTEKLAIKKPYDKSVQIPVNLGDHSRTKQSFAKECDINNIMARYAKTGLISHTNRYNGDYSDLTTQMDFHEATNLIHEAQQAFSSLPSGIRTKFDNDPGKFLEFVDNPENLDEIRELGLGVPLERSPREEGTTETNNESPALTPTPAPAEDAT